MSTIRADGSWCSTRSSGEGHEGNERRGKHCEYKIKKFEGRLKCKKKTTLEEKRGVVEKSSVDVLRIGMAHLPGFYTHLTLRFMKRGGGLRVGVSRDSAPGNAMPPLA